MMDKAKEMREKAAAQMGSKPGAQKPGGKPSTGGKPSSEKENKKPSWSSGQRLRRIYLRSGRFPAAKKDTKPGRRPGGSDARQPNSFASGSMVWLERPDNTIKGIEVKQRRSEFQANYPANDGGWYRVFAYNDLGVQDESRVKLFSYYTFMSHGDKADEKEPELIEREGYYEGSPELELVFVYDDGKRRYREHVGNKIRVRALFRGEPVVKGRMALITEQGWRQYQTTDENGEAQFTLIKEDFHEDGVDRRKSELYLLRLGHTVDNSGEYQGASYENERYVATLPFRVSPALSDWQSKNMAYLAALITIIGAAVAIAIRRRRKKEQ
jgi:hypothetical protein